jgi:hypothetical protein
MRVTSTGALVIGFLGFFVTSAAGPPPAAAQDFPLLPPPPAFERATPPQPFGNLFGLQRPPKTQPAPLPLFPSLENRNGDLAAQTQQTIVCGMRLVPADPKIDAAMRHAVPANGPAFTMRTVPPPVCRR